MTGINEVRERLERACIAGMDAEYVDDVSALLADHARLQAAAINLEQFRDAVKRARDGMWSGCPDTYQQDVPVLDRLLALIDGQVRHD